MHCFSLFPLFPLDKERAVENGRGVISGRPREVWSVVCDLESPYNCIESAVGICYVSAIELIDLPEIVYNVFEIDISLSDLLARQVSFHEIQ